MLHTPHIKVYDRMQEIFRFAWDYCPQYRDMLYSSRKNISPELLDRLGIGLAPANPRGIVDILIKEGYTTEELIEYSIVKEETPDTCVFNHRFMLPFVDEHHRIHSFVGRSIEDGIIQGERVKYRNTKNSVHFQRSAWLYPLNLFDATHKEVLLTEGYFDSIAGIQYGHPASLCMLGIQMTEGQVSWLEDKGIREYSIMLDPDLSGLLGTLKSILLIKSRNMNYRVYIVPSGDDDPDTLGKEKFWELYDKRRLVDEKGYHPLQVVAEVMEVINIDSDKDKAILSNGGWSCLLEFTSFFANQFVVDVKNQIKEQFGKNVSFNTHKHYNLNSWYRR